MIPQEEVRMRLHFFVRGWGEVKFLFKEGDCKNTNLIYDSLDGCDYIIACAAMIGGISYFHEFAYDLIAENERIIASTFDAAIKRFQEGTLKKIIVFK